MTIHRTLLRHSTPSRLSRLREQRFTRTLASRPDFLGLLDGKPRPTPNSQLLDAISRDQPEPQEPSSASSLPSLFSGRSSTDSAELPTQRRSSFDVLGEMARRIQPRPSSGSADSLLSKADRARKSRSIEQTMQRQWRAGDVYAPHDLSPEEAKKYQKSRPPSADVFDVLNINPLDEYKNIPLMMDFVTPLGRLKHQSETGLRPVNQRKISRAVRRASALGLLPRTHAHPEMLRRPGPWQRK